MNTQIIRFLALNGPSLIYAVAQHLSDVSDTKVHYPTVNRRMHELLQRQYLEKAGSKVTKAGIPSDLYSLRIRGQFAALAGIPDGTGSYVSELSPSETRKMIALASSKAGSPFALFNHIIQEGQAGVTLVEEGLIPDVISSVRSGFINIDAPDEEAISSSFASLVARKMIETKDNPGDSIKIAWRDLLRIVNRSLEKALSLDGLDATNDRRRVKPEWANELRALLRIYSVKFG